MGEREGYYVLMLSLHGRVCAEPELGADADTGGQITYVLEEMRALARDPRIRRVDLLTRRFADPRLPAIHDEPVEDLGDGVRIVRLYFGPRDRYLPKEQLWDHLPALVDRTLQWLRETGEVPDWLHSHYADAGFVGVRLAQLLGVPLIHTGHSLGRDKRERLLAAGEKASSIDRRYRFARRIAAEEEILAESSLIFASTRQEVERQYGLYENRARAQFEILPPGVDLARFAPPSDRRRPSPLLAQLRRFLQHPRKPPILAIARPDGRKNLQRLLTAYAGSALLREQSNLVLVMGQRERLDALEPGAREVVTDILQGIDDHDLYGSVAIPKSHHQDDIPEYYRFASQYRGVFVNPALTEPFGLTLLEAAASGLPVVATRNGGPQDILRNCRNGILVDPMEPTDIARALETLLTDGRRWQQASRAGLRGVTRVYSWDAHARAYLRRVERIRHRERKSRRRRRMVLEQNPSFLPKADHLLVCDIDNTLVGDDAQLQRLIAWLRARPQVALAVATGRNLEQTLAVLAEHEVPNPEIFITDVGTRITYRQRLHEDQAWAAHLRHRWWREGVLEVLRSHGELRLQEKAAQSEFKVSYYFEPQRPPSVPALLKALREKGIAARAIVSHQRYLDILPSRASKGHAIRFLCFRWGLPLDCVLTAGDSGNDLDMLGGGLRSVVVGNHTPELEELRGHAEVYFAKAACAGGILEGIHHYHFAGAKDD
ncbi:MAG: HAD-IIB family hydrolase [Acidithiobacillus sp.]|uniref:HAD-IIB family hydrolase n=1 Tax=Acidithiobacillus sp. TaxID=1872118 RepID=UPI003CFD7837